MGKWYKILAINFKGMDFYGDMRRPRQKDNIRIDVT
jgi:hypothetical protein